MEDYILNTLGPWQVFKQNMFGRRDKEEGTGGLSLYLWGETLTRLTQGERVCVCGGMGIILASLLMYNLFLCSGFSWKADQPQSHSYPRCTECFPAISQHIWFSWQHYVKKEKYHLTETREPNFSQHHKAEFLINQDLSRHLSVCFNV